jgi:hypothetical protein
MLKVQQRVRHKMMVKVCSTTLWNTSRYTVYETSALDYALMTTTLRFHLIVEFDRKKFLPNESWYFCPYKQFMFCLPSILHTAASASCFTLKPVKFMMRN